MGAGYADEFSSQQARLLCEATANGAHLQCAYPVCLESRPLLVGYSVYNVRQCADPNYLEFDAKVRYAGATGCYIAIGNAGTAYTHGIATDSVTVAEGTRIHKDYHTSLGVTLTNPYGTTNKAIPLDGQLAAQPTDGIEGASAAPAPGTRVEISTMSGVRLPVASAGNLPKGIYIVTEGTGGSKACRKVVAGR